MVESTRVDYLRVATMHARRAAILGYNQYHAPAAAMPSSSKAIAARWLVARAHPAATIASIARPMPHWHANAPEKITRLNADSARPASSARNAWATAGWHSAIT